MAKLLVSRRGQICAACWIASLPPPLLCAPTYSEPGSYSPVQEPPLP